MQLVRGRSKGERKSRLNDDSRQRHEQSRKSRTESEPGAQGGAAPPPPPPDALYSLSEALSPKKGSCSIMSIGILMLGTFSL